MKPRVIFPSISRPKKRVEALAYVKRKLTGMNFT